MIGCVGNQEIQLNVRVTSRCDLVVNNTYGHQLQKHLPNQEEPIDYDNSNLDSLRFASSQGSIASASPISSSPPSSFSSISSPSFLPSSYERKRRVLPCKFLRKTTRCQTCPYLMDCKDIFTSNLTKRKYNFICEKSTTLSCTSSNIIYLLSCKKCHIQYVA